MKSSEPAVLLWAIFRVMLGIGQMTGALVSAVLLFRLGIVRESVTAAAITVCLTLVSVLLFRVLKLHESRLRPEAASSLRKYTAEAFGTFALVFAGTGAIVINEASAGAITHIGIALTFGLIVLAMIYTVGDISGAHLNPAVSLGFFAARRFPLREVVPYAVSQCAGAFAASGILRILFPQNVMLGATVPAGSVTQSFILELILSAVLMFVILGVSTGAAEKGITAGIVVGAVIGLEAMFAGPICGASMNPARSLAPAVVSGHVQHLWIYLVAPGVGACVGVLGCRCVREPGCCSPAG